MKIQNTNDLYQAVNAYLDWMASEQYSPHTIELYQWILKHWVAFANASGMYPRHLFTSQALKAFESESELKSVNLAPIRGLAQYLYKNDQLEVPVKKSGDIPDIYEKYLGHYKNTRNVEASSQILRARTPAIPVLPKNHSKRPRNPLDRSSFICPGQASKVSPSRRSRAFLLQFALGPP